MTENRYHVVYNGRLLPGFKTDEAKTKLMALLSLSAEKAESLLKKPRFVIKKNVAPDTAQKIGKALKRAGLDIVLVKAQPEATSAQPAAPLSVQTVKSAEAKRLNGALAKDETPLESGPVKTDRIPFEFQGSGTGYFKIWIVNAILSILTLGIYSAWAKVRRKQYFYGNTSLKGAVFEYLADPKKILKGRILVAVVFLLFSALNSLLPVLGNILSLVFIFILPWVVIRSLKFNARNSAIRNIRFDFKGRYRDAAKAYVLWPIVSVFTLGILFPYVYFRQKQFIAENSTYGTTPFKFDATAASYYRLFLSALVPFGVGLLLVAAAGFLFFPAAPFFVLLLYLYLFAFFSVKTTNLLYNSSRLRSHRFEADLHTWEYILLVVTNSIAIALTLGLFHPWAKVRTFRYKLNHLVFTAKGDLETFVAAEQEQVSAIGDEISDFFDMDIGL